MDDEQLDRRGKQELGVGLPDEKHLFQARFACRVSANMRGGAGDRKAENAVKKIGRPKIILRNVVPSPN